MSRTVTSYEVDGVEVHYVETDDDLTHATLTFAVGNRDETLPEREVLHALEHIVMDAVRVTPIEVNAHVSHSTTEFEATGRPQLVAEHLERVCLALADPPVARLAAEARILAAELADADDQGSVLLAARHGCRDLGLDLARGPGPDGLTEDQVRMAAQSWFVAGNAVLLLTGPRPAELRLPLRPGRPPAHTRPDVRRWPAACAIAVDGPACSASLLLPPPGPDGLDELADRLINLRLREVLRHRQGLTYVLETEFLDDIAHPDGGRGSHLLVHAAPLADRAAEAAQVLVGELRSLLLQGPDPAELERALETLAEDQHGVESVLERVRVRAMDRLLGVPKDRYDPDRAAAVQLGGICEYLRTLANDVLFLLPDTVDLDALGLDQTEAEPAASTSVPAGQLFRPSLGARLRYGEARHACLSVSSAGLWMRVGRTATAIDWDKIAGVLVDDDGDATVYGLDGTVIVVGPTMWSHGAAAVDSVRSKVPTHLIYPCVAATE